MIYQHHFRHTVNYGEKYCITLQFLMPFFAEKISEAEFSMNVQILKNEPKNCVFLRDRSVDVYVYTDTYKHVSFFVCEKVGRGA